MCAVMGRPELKTMRSEKKPEVGDIGTMRAGSEGGVLHDAPPGHVCHLEPLEDSGLTDSESESTSGPQLPGTLAGQSFE